MTDLVSRLREYGLGFGIGPAALCQEAAAALGQRDAEIERLRAENERLREALKPFAAGCFWDNGDLIVDRGSPSLDDVGRAFWVLRKKTPASR